MKLSKLKKLAEKATPGPWYAVDDSKVNGCISDVPSWTSENYTVSPERNCPGWQTDSGIEGYSISKMNASFIAAANPATILSLIAKLEMADSALEHIAKPTQRGTITGVDVLSKSITVGDFHEVYDERAEIAKAALAKLREEV